MVVLARGTVRLSQVCCEAPSFHPHQPRPLPDAVPLPLVQLQAGDHERCKQLCMLVPFLRLTLQRTDSPPGALDSVNALCLMCRAAPMVGVSNTCTPLGAKLGTCHTLHLAPARCLLSWLCKHVLDACCPS